MAQRSGNDRFGIAESTIIKAIEEHRGVIRAGCYVPTCEEVATKDAAWLESILIGWWWEAPTKLIADWGQVQEAVTALRPP